MVTKNCLLDSWELNITLSTWRFYIINLQNQMPILYKLFFCYKFLEKVLNEQMDTIYEIRLSTHIFNTTNIFHKLNLYNRRYWISKYFCHSKLPKKKAFKKKTTLIWIGRNNIWDDIQISSICERI